MPALFLYEPRMLLRTVVTSLVEGNDSAIQSFPVLPHLTENVCSSTAENKIMLVGLGGAGAAFPDLLRFIRSVKTFKVKTLVWVPDEYPWLQKLLSTIYAGRIILEENLGSALLPALNELSGLKTISYRSSNATKRPRRMTQTELEILLQFASGLSSREMADNRKCSYKTIFSWKHNICEALNIETNAQWLEMLTEIVQLSSMYQAGQSYGSL
ncbi:MAG TPA: LuxR C-terminal-related transcriptional regulator [Scandinavium sp.]|uniref:helix-turn-helix transcriptional regulator n=1 Tax=Scandinavium sp. TaxID=2830653 RepID=UPI002E311859|nr:LuxR C-terminal-related transcriptional regulator [Scandinavium sp.]HEX4501884.1 LuxR C-terminal-related transcriptional regulator [Scandinavium sp.]